MTKARRIDGVDLSNFQAHLKIDWPEAKKAGVRFVYHKATEGTGFIDGTYVTRRAEAKVHGVPFGAYHFARPTLTNAADEAAFFLKHAAPAKGDMVPALDLEANDAHLSEDQLTKWVEEWFAHVFKETGVSRGLLYTPFNLSRRPKGVHLWVARYNNDNRLPQVRQPFKTWAFWQFSDGKFGVPSVVPGIGRVDIDTMHASLPWVRLSRFMLPTVKPRHRVPKPAPETPIDTIVRLAKSQVGYHEGRDRNGTWNNIQKFSPQVPTLAWSQGQAWCCTFVSWCAEKSNLAGYYPCTASCRTAMEWWKAHNLWSEYPAIGAQVIYGNGEHTGLVVGYDADYIYAVEGNTNNNGSAEGDGVYLKKRPRRDAYVTGYGYPQIPGVRLKSADPNYPNWK